MCGLLCVRWVGMGRMEGGVFDSQRGDHWRRSRVGVCFFSRAVVLCYDVSFFSIYPRHELTIELYMLLVGGLPILF